MNRNYMGIDNCKLRFIYYSYIAYSIKPNNILVESLDSAQEGQDQDRLGLTPQIDGEFAIRIYPMRG